MADENKLTIAQILNEATTFKYSQEYYELYKECAEADLMATWLEAQEFNDYNKELLAINEGYMVESTYLVEAAEAEQNTAIHGKWKEKVKNILKRISDICVKLIKMIITLFEKLLMNDAKVNEYRKIINSEDGYKALNEKVEDVKKILAKNYKPSKLWTAASKFNRAVRKFVKISGTIPNTEVGYAELLGAAILDNPGIEIRNGVKICELNDFKDFAKETLDSLNASKFNLKYNGIKGGTFKITFDDGMIGEAITALKKVLSDYQKLKNESKKDSESDNTGEDQNAVNALKYSADMNEAVSNLITVYKELYSFRKNTIFDLYKLIKNDKKVEEKKSEENNK